MGIKYDGADFETVEQLVKYKRLMEDSKKSVENGDENGNNNGIQMEKAEIQQKTVIVQQPKEAERPTQRRGKKWTFADRRQLAELFWEHAQKGKIRQKVHKKIAKIMNRSLQAISCAISNNKAYIQRKKPKGVATYKPNTNWSDDERTKLLSLYDKYLKGDQLKRGSIYKIAHEIGRTMSGVQKEMYSLVNQRKEDTLKLPEATKQPIKREPQNKVWTEDKVKQLTELFWQNTNGKGRLRHGSMKRIAEQMDIAFVTAKNGVCLNKDAIQKGKPTDYMMRKHAVKPTSFDEHRLGMLKGKSKTALNFNELTAQGNQRFLEMLQFLVGHKHRTQIGFHEIVLGLERSDGKEWTVSLWKSFCMNFIKSTNYVCFVLKSKRFKVEQKEFKLVILEGTVVIRHEGGE